MRWFLFVICYFLIVPQALAGLEDSVVGLYVDKGSGDSEVGSGFYTSKDGQILTAYHVIRGATKIKVRDAQENWYHNLSIDYIAPDYDLAVLQINDSVGKKPFLDISFRIPPPSEQLNIIGYPRDLPRQHIYARSTSNQLLDSFALRTSSGKRIFKENIQVIPLDVLIYGGMSGAPVIGKHSKVLGVLSGSLAEGGAIAWAIPSKHSNVKNYIKLGKRPEEVSTWPDLPTRKDVFRSLTRPYRINAVGERRLEEYLDAVSHFSSSSNRIIDSAIKVQTQIYILRPLLQMVLSDPALANDRQAVLDLLDFPIQEFVKALGNFGKASEDNSSASQEVVTHLLDLANWASSETSLDMDENRRLEESLYRIDTEYRSGPLESFFDSINADQAGFVQAYTKLARDITMMGRDPQSSMGTDFARAVLELIPKIEPYIQKHSSQEIIIYLRHDVSRFRSIASAFEPIVYRRKSGSIQGNRVRTEHPSLLLAAARPLKTFKDYQQRFQFRYPMDWQVFTPSEFNAIIKRPIKVPPDTVLVVTNPYDFSSNLNIQIMYESPFSELNSKLIEQFARGNDLNFLYKNSGFRKLSHRGIWVNDVQALEYNVFRVEGGIRLQQVLFAKNRRFFIITCSARDEKFDEIHKHYFKVIINSFETW